MWQGVGACGRGWWQGWGYGIGRQVYDKDGHKWQGSDMWQGLKTCGRLWGQVAGVGACGRGWICENMTNVKKSKMLTINEVHKNFNLT